MRAITHTDRVALGALAVADLGVGIFLCAVATLPGVPVLHAVVGVVALLLALPAAVAAIMGALPALADEGVVVNVGVLTFAIGEVLSLPADPWQRLGLALLLLAATGDRKSVV